VLDYTKLHNVHAISLGPAGFEDPTVLQDIENVRPPLSPKSLDGKPARFVGGQQQLANARSEGALRKPKRNFGSGVEF